MDKRAVIDFPRVDLGVGTILAKHTSIVTLIIIIVLLAVRVKLP
jgi:hypothetical protein